MTLLRNLLLFLAVAALCPAGAAALAADTGTITGTVDKPEQVTGVTAVDRLSASTDKKFKGTIDAKTGGFTIEALPVGATYDVIVEMGDALLEGVNLKVPHSDYEEEQPLTAEDVKALKERALEFSKFENDSEVLAVEGNIQHAAVVVRRLRTKPFINQVPGEIIWRLDLLHFERPEETWAKSQEELSILLHRERIQKSVYDKKALTLDPALGGLQLTAKQPKLDLGKVKLASKEPGIRLRSDKTQKTEKPGTSKGG